ncbi:probable G-protein coupled receptor CG31760 isoform X2 [Condylostylus longicornis]|uniref:probable G-protein coupled receptor CG31760 isoform X2 n=1 Tax=Condylostylus longicornis TaxID=2530218 RepID=UPI00244DC8C6|nr:probable G-protein coupled receptor CG31760 isoform X2 [Condylostylus longicornis]XP_055376153.1 probable G-protein coupled receptor CG31760 isoform X2 [Condylostylus longicornis]XP_055376154.1 probable G-protein coupled receptor CG31760 isoform X2 [Condylostylus longicornis]
MNFGRSRYCVLQYSVAWLPKYMPKLWNIHTIIFGLLIVNSQVHGRRSTYSKLSDGNVASEDAIENSLTTIHDISTENLGILCLKRPFHPLEIPVNAERYDNARQKADLAATVLQEVGIRSHSGLTDALAKGLLSDIHVYGAKVLALNVSNGAVMAYVWWIKNERRNLNSIGEPIQHDDSGIQIGEKPDMNYPWFEDEISSPGLRSPKFAPTPPNLSFKGWWTYPYFICEERKWMLSYSVAIPPYGRHGLRGFISVDIDISNLRINQCEPPAPRILYRDFRISSRFHLGFDIIDSNTEFSQDVEAFHGSHKCHRKTMMCDYRSSTNLENSNNIQYMKYNGRNHISSISSTSSSSVSSSINNNNRIFHQFVSPYGWVRGSYQCLCKQGYYSERHPDGFNGTIMEVAYQEYQDNISIYYVDVFKCLQCAPGCEHCLGPEPCLAGYNWPFRISLLIISVCCAISTILLAGYMFRHRRKKIFKVASPIFLSITLIGCAIMYLEMAAIFPILDTYFCIATKWTRHMGFCITYTSLLMKTWRVSLTYRVKSAHKVKLTDKQLLQWMIPILLVMLIYLGTWTLSAAPTAENIEDQDGLKFKQCSYNWWDHSLAIGEVLFLAWGVRVCYNVRNAESLYNEARQISYAIYNIAIVNITMVAFHLLIFPQAGPDIKYLLGFIRTQLSTSVTIVLVFGPKVLRVLRGQGDQWDNKARVRSITASFSLNGVGLVPEDSPDLYQENEELKEEIQKLAHQIEFMKTVHMQMNNRHIKPKPGGYFTITSTSFQTPTINAKGVTSATTQTSCKTSHPNSCVSDDGHSGSNSVGTNSMGYPAVHNVSTSVTNNGSEKV